jgi:hypothetical protein
MQPAQGFPEHFNFIFRRSFLALGLLQGAKNLLNLVEHPPQLRPDVQHLLDRFANTRGRLLSFLSGAWWLVTALVPVAPVLALLSASSTATAAIITVPAAPAAASEARTTSTTLTAWRLGFARGSGLRFGGFYRISGWFLCIHLYLPANFCFSRLKINGNKHILC